jgi:MYXO-CTERM domain-containing protein
VWTIQGIAEDAGGLIGESEEITFIVGDPPPSTTSGGETTGGTDSTGGTASTGGTTGGEPTGGEPTSGEPTSGAQTSGTLPVPSTSASATGFDMDLEDDGCGCRSSDDPRAPLGLVILGLALPLLRRRR